MNTIEPLHDRVVIKRIPVETRSETGNIIIPDNAQEKSARGHVKAAGPGRVSEKGLLIETSVKPGDEVIFGKHSGTEVKVDGEDLVIVAERDILCIICS